MTKLPVCPECGTSHPYQRRPSIQDNDVTHAYRCEAEDCGHRFDTPEYREPRTQDCIPGNSLAARLADENTTPEDIGL